MTAAQNFERVYTPRCIRLTYENYKNKHIINSIFKFFSSQTVYTYCTCLFTTKNQIKNLITKTYHNMCEQFAKNAYLII